MAFVFAAPCPCRCADCPQHRAAPTASRDVFRTSIVQPGQRRHQRTRYEAHETQAQARPVGEPEKPISSPGLPTGLPTRSTRSIAYPSATPVRRASSRAASTASSATDSTNTCGSRQLLHFQEYPLGFNTGTVPIVSAGLRRADRAAILDREPGRRHDEAITFFGGIRNRCSRSAGNCRSSSRRRTSSRSGTHRRPLGRND